ncbi:MAG TPA: error-prone DNA polymerase [Puia sp.]|uniref:error-prone DNA polymerase n=1 Tax=Puia sp. TaxID=2045100 RepID=UPI002BFB2C1F|nr:error-prone DNA polymerase [Puia sp.]HVU94491.1 error-prone DNA polymerase [Puia sp.]
MEYAELQVTSNFSFLRGASHPEELVEQAAGYGYAAVALTDRNSLAGLVRAHKAAKSAGIRFIPAARLDLVDGPDLLAYPTDKDAYARLSSLLTLGMRRVEKGQCALYRTDVYAKCRGIKFIVIPPEAGVLTLFDLNPTFQSMVAEYREALGAGLYLAAIRRFREDDDIQLHRLHELGRRLDIGLVATGDVHYHSPDRRQLQDVLTCTREHVTIQQAGYRLHPHAERHMKHRDEIERLFRAYPSALRRTLEIAEACTFSLSELKYVYPREITSAGRTPQQELAFLVYRGLGQRFPGGIPEKIQSQVDFELDFIARKNFAEYFLTVEDICRFAREQGILYQGRGSAANCSCCYYLGITNVDPARFDLLFERFLSDARDEPPDIDVDFEHERREEVIQYIYDKYGRDRAAIVATVTQLHQKGAVRDVGKAMGLSEDALKRLSDSVWEFSPEWFEGRRLSEQGFDPADPLLQKILELTAHYLGFPRQLGQHSGGFVITDGQLSDLCPIFNARMEARTNICWDKNDIDALGFLKIDVLALGMLTAIRKAFDYARENYGVEYTLYNIPQDDPLVYAMISAADTIGVFQIESRAQQAMLPRMKPTCFYDLVIEVAIVRPGPIVGGMVHPYLARRNGLEPVTYPSEALKKILQRTLGVPLFQEQVMSIGIEAAGLTAAEADGLRRSMATFKGQGIPPHAKDRLISGMLRKGYTREYADKLVSQIAGFGSYGFPESHSASFAHLVYVSSYLKYYHPDVFATAILNSLPMGFYAPAELIDDAKAHGVLFLPIDVNCSQWDYELVGEEGQDRCFVRMGFRAIDGIREDDILLLIAGRIRPYPNVASLLDAGLTLSALERLADADAFTSMGLDRRAALWQIAKLGTPATHRRKEADGTIRLVRQLDLFTQSAAEHTMEEGVHLPALELSEHVVEDFATTGLSLRAHPVYFLRYRLREIRALSAAEIGEAANGRFVSAAGLILVRQRPSTAKGVCFVTIKDETGVVNLIVWPKVFDEYRHALLSSKLLLVKGHVQLKDGVRHIIVQKAMNLNNLLSLLSPDLRDDIALRFSRADEKDGTPFPESLKKEGAAAVMPDGRNFR